MGVQMEQSESQTSVELPVLDISQPFDTSSLCSLTDACNRWGFFPSIIMESQESFILLHSLSLRVSGPNFFASAQNSANFLFDQQSTSEFSKLLQEYGTKMTELSKKIVEILLMSLGDCLKKKYSVSEFKNCHGYLRIINYSPPETLEDEVEGLGMHTDMSCVTTVYQDQIGGLQVKSKEGNWMDIRPCEGTLVVNIGDMFEAWSNANFQSSEHRGVLKRPVNSLSLAFFWCFEDEKVILAPEEVVGEENMRLYKPFVCLDYVKFRVNRLDSLSKILLGLDSKCE